MQQSLNLVILLYILCIALFYILSTLLIDATISEFSDIIIIIIIINNPIHDALIESIDSLSWTSENCFQKIYQWLHFFL